MKSDKCRVAVIGTGNIGYHHCRNYKRINEAALIAVADKNIQKAMEVAREFECKYYDNYIKLLNEEQPIAVSVSVPTKSHYDIVKECLLRGIHVLVEKPISIIPGEISELIMLAKQKSVLLTVGHVERFNPALQKLKSIIDDGNLGELTNIMSRRLGGYPSKLTDVGVYYDLAVHDLDIFYYLTQLLPEQLSVHKLNVFSKDLDDSTTVFIEYPHCSGVIQVNWITPVKIRQLAVTGTRGYAEVNYINQSLSLYETNVDPNDFVERDFHEFLSRYGNLTKREVDIVKEEPLYLELRNFIGAIQDKEQLVVKTSEVLKTMNIMSHYDH
jgi:UDP-N-acetylglucosamine 3-dehydrogenase